MYKSRCKEGGEGLFGFATTCNEGGGGEITTFTWFYNGMTSPMIEHLTSGNSYFKLWVANVVPYLNLGNSIVPQVPKYIVTYSTASLIDCDLFYCFDN